MPDVYLYPVNQDGANDVRLSDPRAFRGQLAGTASMYAYATATYSSSSRYFSSAEIAQLDARHVRPVTFVSLAFDQGMQRLHDGIGAITWGGYTWSGVGTFGGIETIEEGDDVAPYAIRLRLSGINAAMASEALTGNYTNAAVQIYLGFMGSGAALVDTPKLMWSGTADVMDVQAGTESMIQLTCESDLASVDRANGRLYSSTDLKSRYPGDTFFDFIPRLQELSIRWQETKAGKTGHRHFFNWNPFNKSRFEFPAH